MFIYWAYVYTNIFISSKVSSGEKFKDHPAFAIPLYIWRDFFFHRNADSQPHSASSANSLTLCCAFKHFYTFNTFYQTAFQKRLDLFALFSLNCNIFKMYNQMI